MRDGDALQIAIIYCLFRSGTKPSACISFLLIGGHLGGFSCKDMQWTIKPKSQFRVSKMKSVKAELERIQSKKGLKLKLFTKQESK